MLSCNVCVIHLFWRVYTFKLHLKLFVWKLWKLNLVHSAVSLGRIISNAVLAADVSLKINMAQY